MNSNVEIHYHLENGIHVMDAFAKNKAESEILKLFKEVSILLELELDFESKAIREGGIREFFRLLDKRKNRKKAKKILIYLGLILTNITVNVISDRINSDPEQESVNKEKPS